MRSTLLVAMLLISTSAWAGEGSSELAEAAKKAALDAETWPAGSVESRGAWSSAATAYLKWLNRYEATAQAPRMRYGYANALAGAGQPESALQQLEQVLAEPDLLTPEIVRHGALLGAGLADDLEAAQGDRAAEWQRRRLELVESALVHLEPHGDSVPLRLDAASVYAGLGKTEQALSHLSAARARAEGAQLEAATAQSIELVQRAGDWAAVHSVAKSCHEDRRLAGTVTVHRCAEWMEQAQWRRLSQDDSLAEADRGRALLQYVRDNPRSEHRREALIRAQELLAQTDPAAAREAAALFVDHFPLDEGAVTLAAAVARSFADDGKAADAARWWVFVGEQEPQREDAAGGLATAASALDGADARSAWAEYLRLFPKGKQAGKAKKTLKKLGG